MSMRGSPWRRLFERAAVLEICSNSGRPEAVVAEFVAIWAAAARRRIIA
jgi:hypothetical protein